MWGERGACFHRGAPPLLRPACECEFGQPHPAVRLPADGGRLARAGGVLGDRADELRQLAEQSFERGLNPAGAGRQLAAIIASGDRTPLLRTITVPTLVIHGKQDRLVPLSGGRATARAIPGARLLLIEGMGHDLPRGAWPRILDAIEENAARAGAPAA